jgi:hypothetical protein
VDTALQKVLEVLEEGSYRPGWGEVKEVVRELGLEGKVNFASLAKAAMKEGGKRVGEALRGLWELLEVPPPLVVEEALREGERVEARYRWKGGVSGESQEVEVKLERPPWTLHFPLPRRVRSEAFHLEAQGWWLEARVGPDLFVQKKRAFFLAQNRWKVEWALKEVKNLRPLLATLGLSDLEGALEALLAVKPGEARMEGPYSLARGEKDVYLLRRGSLFGNPLQDRAFLLGEQVRLSFSEGVEVVLEGGVFSDGWVGLKAASLRWGEESVPLSRPQCGVNDQRIPTRLIVNGVRWRVRSLDAQLSPKMRALLQELEELGEREDVLDVLADREFFARVYMRALSLF